MVLRDRTESVVPQVSGELVARAIHGCAPAVHQWREAIKRVRPVGEEGRLRRKVAKAKGATAGLLAVFGALAGLGF